MDYDDVIERAGNDVCGAGWVLNDIQLQGILRAAAPILMEYGARLMRDAAAKALIGYIHPDPDELPGRLFASAQVRDLDPATIVKEAVK